MSKKYVTLKCSKCGEKFKRNRRWHRKKHKNVFCSKKCKNAAYNKSKYNGEILDLICDECGESFRRKAHLSRGKRNFCSKKCSKKRKLTGKCANCGCSISSDAERCDSCAREHRYDYMTSKTIRELEVSGRKREHVMTSVRNNARVVAGLTKTSSNTSRCIFCKNDEFIEVIEVAHIKAISEFGDDATIGEINSRDNLLIVCPSHHRMFDKGLISLRNGNGTEKKVV